MATHKTQLVSAYRLARALRLDPDWLRLEATAGRLPHVNAKGRLLFNADAVAAVLAERASRENLRQTEGGA